jgi:hypothetical protein
MNFNKISDMQESLLEETNQINKQSSPHPDSKNFLNIQEMVPEDSIDPENKKLLNNQDFENDDMQDQHFNDDDDLNIKDIKSLKDLPQNVDIDDWLQP